MTDEQRHEPGEGNAYEPPEVQELKSSEGAAMTGAGFTTDELGSTTTTALVYG